MTLQVSQSRFHGKGRIEEITLQASERNSLYSVVSKITLILKAEKAKLELIN